MRAEPRRVTWHACAEDSRTHSHNQEANLVPAMPGRLKPRASVRVHVHHRGTHTTRTWPHPSDCRYHPEPHKVPGRNLHSILDDRRSRYRPVHSERTAIPPEQSTRARVSECTGEMESSVSVRLPTNSIHLSPGLCSPARMWDERRRRRQRW